MILKFWHNLWYSLKQLKISIKVSLTRLNKYILKVILFGCFCVLLLLYFWIYHRCIIIRNFYILSSFYLSTNCNWLPSVQGWLVSYRVLREFFFPSLWSKFLRSLCSLGTHTSLSNNWIGCWFFHCLYHNSYIGIQGEKRQRW